MEYSTHSNPSALNTLEDEDVLTSGESALMIGALCTLVTSLFCLSLL